MRMCGRDGRAMEKEGDGVWEGDRGLHVSKREREREREGRRGRKREREETKRRREKNEKKNRKHSSA